MRNLRFGRKVTLPSTIAIKHQVRMLMALEIKKGEDAAKAEEFPGPPGVAAPAALRVADINPRRAFGLV